MTQVLTPGYAPLEQYSTRSRFGPPTDVYALAATLYRLVSGQKPPAPADRVHGVRLVALTELDRRVPPGFSAAIERALALEAAARPQTVSAFLAELRGTTASAARPASAPTPAVRSTPATVSPLLPAGLPDWTGWARNLSGHVQRLMDVKWPRPAPPPPANPPLLAWLPFVVALAAVASVAPLHVVAAVVLLALPAANAVVRTRRRYHRRRRWHDHVTEPVVFLSELGQAIAVAVAEAAVPVAVVGSATAVALWAVRRASHGAYPMPAARLLVALAAVTVVVWLVQRLQRQARYPRTFGRDLTGWVVTAGGRVSSRGRVLWALSVGSLLLALVAPRAPLG